MLFASKEKSFTDDADYIEFRLGFKGGLAGFMLIWIPLKVAHLIGVGLD